MYDLLGGRRWPAGMMAAGTEAGQGASVLVLDKNQRPGRKLLITGKGRCNVTNCCDVDTFLSAVRHNARFLYSAARAFPPERTMRFFEELDVPLKVERGNRVFPQSDRAVDIVDAMNRFMRRSGAEFETASVQELLMENGAVTGVITDKGKQIPAETVLIATGGKSYPLTGSTGDGYRLAKQAGHTVMPPIPSLVPIVIKEPWCGELMGLSLKNVALTLKKGEKELFSELGEMLFTHFGVSGPLVLSASSHMDEDASHYTLSIELKPGLTEEQLDARLLRDFAENKNREFKNSLGALLPKRLIPVVVRASGIPAERQVNAITRQERRALLEVLKSLQLTPKAFRPIDEAIVTAGGVNVKEVDPKTMCSKKSRGLCFAGEVLDLDAYTGGYNLQIAFCTGYLAGSYAAKGEK